VHVEDLYFTYTYDSQCVNKRLFRIEVGYSLAIVARGVLIMVLWTVHRY